MIDCKGNELEIGDYVKVVGDQGCWLKGVENLSAEGRLDLDNAAHFMVVTDEYGIQQGSVNNIFVDKKTNICICEEALRFFPDDFEKVGGGYNIYRPVLEERKIGKVKVELVDLGFPNALWELAKVLTWAGDAKGYKPHDWQNLPDALQEFPAAASRHRMQFNKGELTDPESGFSHKVHELFNVMAELELMLKNKENRQ